MGPLENHEFSLIPSSVVNCLRVAYAMLANANRLNPTKYRCVECGTILRIMHSTQRRNAATAFDLLRQLLRSFIFPCQVCFAIKIIAYSFLKRDHTSKECRHDTISYFPCFYLVVSQVLIQNASTNAVP